MLSGLAESLLSLIFPPQCEICKTALGTHPTSGVCAQCESEIRWIRPPHCISCGRAVPNIGLKCEGCQKESFHFDRAYACALYDGKMKELLHRYKFGGRKQLKHFFLKKAAEFVNAHLNRKEFDAIAAVPLDRRKKLDRGFNQSELISKPLAKQLNVEDLSKVLRRHKSISSQALLSKEDRRKNVRGCFEVKNKNSFASKKVLLIDDILTTGQTASECAKTLKEAGARSVCVLACARGL